MTLTTSFNNLEMKVQTLEDRLMTHGTRLLDVKHTIEGRKEGWPSDIAGMQEKIQMMEKRLNDRFDEMQEMEKHLNDRFDEIAASQHELNTSQKTLLDRIGMFKVGHPCPTPTPMTPLPMGHHLKCSLHN
jgi:chromosome segregation ATPase